MKIRLVAPQFPPMTGGMETYAFEVATELSARGHNVDVITLRENQFVEAANFECLPQLYGHAYLDRQLIEAGQSKYDVTHVMNAAWSWISNKFHPTFLSIHGNDFLAPNPVDGLALKTRFRLPFGDSLDYRIAKWRTVSRLPKHMQSLRKIFTNSKFTKDRFANLFPDLEAKTEVGLLGLGREFQSIPIAGQKQSKRSVHLITVCRLSEPRKNIDNVIRALSSLKSEFEFCYHVVGEGSLKNGLKELAKDAQTSDRVTFHGRISSNQMISLLQESDLFVLVPRWEKTSFEGFGIVYLEANACGTPVLAADIAGPAEAVRDGVSGFFSSGTDSESIATSLRKFFNGEHRFDSHECVKFAKSFSWSNLVDQFEAAYKSSLLPRRR